MSLYRLQYDAAGYLDFEVVGQSRDEVIRRFSAAARAWCKKSGGTWAEAAIEDVTSRQYGSTDRERPDLIETMGPGVTVDGEGFWGYEF